LSLYLVAVVGSCGVALEGRYDLCVWYSVRNKKMMVVDLLEFFNTDIKHDMMWMERDGDL